MIDWKPISEEALRARITQGVARMTESQRCLWNAVRIAPEKWQQIPYGEAGLGFWVVAVIGKTVLWYNDIEEGFNRSRYSIYGKIDDYWVNQDELEVAIEYLSNAVYTGADLVLLPDIVKPFVR
ncbi:MAG: hypothetical protein ABSF50_16655 [Burkholderiaceae bacterium]|jgi:hypothetical protein